MTVRVLVALCAAAVLGVLTASDGGPPPRDALEPTVATALALFAHNAAAALWPLALVGLGWPRMAGVGSIGDVVMSLHLAMQGLNVGWAIGATPRLWPYLPHLPLEWLGLAIPAATWWTARRAEAPVAVAYPATACLFALAGAAVIETWAVPL